MLSRPSWQIDECPSWCTGEHREGDHPDDRVHRGVPTTVPVVARRTSFEAAGVRRDTDATEFEVALSRVDGEPETWLYVGAGPAAAIDVSGESGERLVRAMSDVLRSR